VDFVIEGYVDPEEDFLLEGPFGDHTGFYSLADFYPRFHVTCITHRKDAVYPATLVGIPPMEDAWIGKATERIFTAPIRLTMIPELVDMDLPFAGVAHNISIVKIRKSFPGQAIKVMNSLWGAGQMMFNKIMVVVDSEVDIHDYTALARLFRDHFDAGGSLHFSKGPLDILDHSSSHGGFGSKLGIDLTIPFPEEVRAREEESYKNTLHPADLAQIPFVSGFRDLLSTISLPVLLLTVMKNEKFSKPEWGEILSNLQGLERFKAVIMFDHGASLDDIFSLVWLLGGNLEPGRDISWIRFPGNGTHKVMLVDATIKTSRHDRFQRDWPNIVTMDDLTIASVDRKWPLNELGEFLPSPSIKYKPLVKGRGAVRK
jgi:4-hydroxy-3-polyprenylbenzoate decarboxylase